jgi:thioredoxin-related protein
MESHKMLKARFANIVVLGLVCLVPIGCDSNSLPAPGVESVKVEVEKNNAKSGAVPLMPLKPAAADDSASSNVLPSNIAADKASEKAPAKKSKPPIYVEQANGKDLIAAAITKAKLDHKNVLIEWGGNWCGWCYKLHDVFHKDPLVRPMVYEEFELVLVDERANRDLMMEYGGRDRKYSFPHLTVLDSDGIVLTNQETGSLEEGPNHDPKLVAQFLQKWTPVKQDADMIIKAALDRAKQDSKRVLVRVGDPYCGWCKVLATFVHEHADVLSKDYVDVKIDTLRMTQGKELSERLKPKGCDGVPWMVILDASGAELANSIGPGGNIGCPSEPEEIEHFGKMLMGTRQNMTEEDIAALKNDLIDRREKRKAKL